MVKRDASHVEEETRVKLAAMLLREFGRPSQRRARWIFVEVLLARAPASGRPRTGSARSGRRESSRARESTKSFVSRKEGLLRTPEFYLSLHLLHT